MCCVCINDAKQVIDAFMDSDLVLQCSSIANALCTGGYRLRSYPGTIKCDQGKGFLGWEKRQEKHEHLSHHKYINKPKKLQERPQVSTKIRKEVGDILREVLPPIEARTADAQAIVRDTEAIFQVRSSLQTKSGYQWDSGDSPAFQREAVARTTDMQLDRDALTHAKHISNAAREHIDEVLSCIFESKRRGVDPMTCKKNATKTPAPTPTPMPVDEASALGVEDLEKKLEHVDKRMKQRRVPTVKPTVWAHQEGPVVPTNRPTSQKAALEASIQQRIQDELLGLTEPSTPAPGIPTKAPSMPPTISQGGTTLAALAARLHAEQKQLAIDRKDGDSHGVIHVKHVMAQLTKAEMLDTNTGH
jgi:hypothetical protein